MKPRTAIVLPKSAEHITSKSHFDPKLLLKLVKGVEEEIEFAAANSIEDNDDEQYAAGRLQDFRSLDKQIAGAEEDQKRSHLDALAQIRKLFKPFRDLVARGVGVYGGAIEDYRIELARERAAALEASQKAARERDHTKLVTALNVAQDSKAQKLEGVSLKLRWEVESVDPAQLPDPWWIPDEKGLEAWARQQPCTDPDKPPVLAGVTFKVGSSKRVSA